MKAIDVYTRCALLLSDVPFARYTKAHMQDWLNDAMLILVSLVPKSSTVVKEIPLAEGVEQELQDVLANQFLSVVSAGYGTVPMMLTLEQIATLFPEWEDMAGEDTVIACAGDPDRPTFFYTVPKVEGTVTAKVKYSVAPATIAAETDVIGIPDEYISPLVNLVLHRCFAHDTGGGSLEKSRQYYTEALTLLGKGRSHEFRG